MHNQFKAKESFIPLKYRARDKSKASLGAISPFGRGLLGLITESDLLSQKSFKTNPPEVIRLIEIATNSDFSNGGNAFSNTVMVKTDKPPVISQ